MMVSNNQTILKDVSNINVIGFNDKSIYLMFELSWKTQKKCSQYVSVKIK